VASNGWKFKQEGSTIHQQWGIPVDSRNAVIATRFSQNLRLNAPDSVKMQAKDKPHGS
jgi:hypothetical protein